MDRKRLFKVPENAIRQSNGLLETKHAAYDASVSLKEPARTTDAFSNPMAKLGYGTQGLLEATQYPLVRLSQNYALLNSLFRNNWVVKKIVSVIPEDMTKKWFKPVTSDINVDIKKMEMANRAIHLRQSIVEGMQWGRLYGGSLGVILIKGQEDFSQPLDMTKILPDSFRGLFIVDRWSGIQPSIEMVDDINDPDFGYPEFYIVRNELGIASYKVHHSRAIRFIGNLLPYYERISEQYWGQSVIESIYQEIVKKDNVSYNIAQLTFKANLDVIEMDNIDQMYAIGGELAQKRFWATVQAQAVAQSNFGTRVINKGDKFNQYQYAFSGLRDVYEALLLDVAGASSIPATRLFGRSPQGMNATGESDQVIYNDHLDEVRESDFIPIIDKLLPIMALSSWGYIPDDLEAYYPAIRTPSEVEKSNIVQRKGGFLLDAFNSDAIPLGLFLQELKSMNELTGIFANIPDELIKQHANTWKRDLVVEQDFMAGIVDATLYAEEDALEEQERLKALESPEPPTEDVNVNE